MFRTKICGVTTPADAEMLANVGVEAVGLNFYERSKRFVDPDAATKIADRLPAHVKRVGVFVNASSEAIREIVGRVSLDYVQLHGDEPPTFLGDLEGLSIIRAFRCEGGLEPVAQYLQKSPFPPHAVLVDAYDPEEYGGTGKTLHWPDLANADKFIGELPLILAGGLTPTNVAAAIQAAQPHAVDSASGVETRAGQKDEKLCRLFIRSAMTAFSA